MQQSAPENLISQASADRLIAAHDGDVALLYIYLQRTGSDLEGAARELCRTMGEIEAAHEKLLRMGLIGTASAPSPAAPAELPRAERQQEIKLPPAELPRAERQQEIKLPPAEELPEYRAEDIVRRSKEDDAFAAIVAEAQKVLGHVLSSSDLKRLFGIYDYLALPPEVVLELLNYCVSISCSPSGEGRRPSMRFIEKEAYAWVHMEIFTLEQAEEYIQKSQLRRGDIGKISEALGIRGRALTPSEQRFISSWLDMGFTLDAIELAYDRTGTNTGALKWGYMNKILQTWHEKKLHTPAEIEANDPRRKPASAAKPAAKQDKPIDLDRLRAALDKM